MTCSAFIDVGHYTECAKLGGLKSLENTYEKSEEGNSDTRSEERSMIIFETQVRPPV